MYSIFRDVLIIRQPIIWKGFKTVFSIALSRISLSYSRTKMFSGQTVGLVKSAQSGFTKKLYS